MTKKLALTLAAALAALALATPPVAGQDAQQPTTDDSTAQPAPPRCDTEEHRLFDFWIGEWTVTNPDGSLAGENTIESILDGCVLRESWESASGAMRGHSFNIYSRAKKKWHQTWVDSNGNAARDRG